MDKTVRLWHVLRKPCLAVFPHVDFVTSVAFHPCKGQFFVSGSLDSKIRIWDLSEKKVKHWIQARGLVTAVAFNRDGSVVMCGLYTGQLCFYETEGLRCTTSIHVRSSRGKNSAGKKITGIQLTPDGDRVMVTSNDSRIRVYNMKNYAQVAKFSGLTNETCQIHATFSESGAYVICGSEDNQVYVWNAAMQAQQKFGSSARNESFETFDVPMVTCTAFAPPQQEVSVGPLADEASSPTLVGATIVCAGYGGHLTVYRNYGLPVERV
eukprot:TRINITY_DN3938_c0_g1_i1.p1 TRINITY_DN3938_c0_g1~~TRINITY_DN3938_c0_g1_i1.p1  ORF type:complete len:266 (-),score=53.79 TRINITY_DN3938_c0_g1_i1:1172-1969(-)